MPNDNFDTRFFIEHYYSHDPSIRRRTAEVIARSRNRFISAIVVSELYKLTLTKEGRDTAKLRIDALVKDLKVINVDKDIAIRAAEIRHKHTIPLADSIIAATSIKFLAFCFTDDPHIKKVKEVRVRWI